VFYPLIIIFNTNKNYKTLNLIKFYSQTSTYN